MGAKCVVGHYVLNAIFIKHQLSESINRLKFWKTKQCLPKFVEVFISWRYQTTILVVKYLPSLIMNGHRLDITIGCWLWLLFVAAVHAKHYRGGTLYWSPVEDNPNQVNYTLHWVFGFTNKFLFSQNYTIVHKLMNKCCFFINYFVIMVINISVLTTC